MKLNLEFDERNQVVNRDTGETHDVFAVADRLPWREQGNPEARDPLRDMPQHWYVVLGNCDDVDWDVLSFVIAKHPGSYLAYFRGYQHPMRYLELGDGYRYWYTAIHGAQMLNRCLLDSVEPPRRVDAGARPICWQQWGAEIYHPQGSGWSEEYRAKHPEMFGSLSPPPCRQAVIAAGDRVKHLPSSRYGTVTTLDADGEWMWVRWDTGSTSHVKRTTLRTPCCLPGEDPGTASPSS